MSPLCRLGIRVRGDRAEPALAALLHLLPAGAEERAVGPDVEYALYAGAGELPAASEIRALVGDALVDVTLAEVPDGWERRWHEHLRIVRVHEAGRSLTVRPPWIAGAAGDLVIHPDVLFGAGTHPTTQLCLRLLLAEPAPLGALADWGAGSGVLAIAAARLGFEPVTAIELDPAAPAVISRNAAANGVHVSPLLLDLAREAPPWVGTVCANLPGELLVRLPARMERPPRRLIASGVLFQQADAIAAAFSPLGLRERRRVHQDGWAALELEAGE